MTIGPAIRLFAHRGARADRPEHSRAAYLEAVRQGADGIETDVRATADGHLVCWHDDTTDRVTGRPGVVGELTLAELRDRVPGGPDELVTLPELLTLMVEAGRSLRLALEIKQPSSLGAGLDDAVLRALDEAGWDPRTGLLGETVRVDIMSFWPQTVSRIRDRVGPGLAMLLLDDSDDEATLVEWVVREAGGRVDAEAARRELSEAAVVRDELRRDGTVGLGPGVAFVRAEGARVREWAARRPVRVWTVNTVEAAELCLAAGIRELTTDRPGALRQELSGRQDIE